VWTCTALGMKMAKILKERLGVAVEEPIPTPKQA